MIVFGRITYVVTHHAWETDGECRRNQLLVGGGEVVVAVRCTWSLQPRPGRSLDDYSPRSLLLFFLIKRKRKQKRWRKELSLLYI